MGTSLRSFAHPTQGCLQMGAVYPEPAYAVGWAKRSVPIMSSHSAAHLFAKARIVSHPAVFPGLFARSV